MKSPNHAITIRPPTDQERKILIRNTKPSWGSWGCITLFLGIVPCILLGILFRWLGEQSSSSFSLYSNYIGIIVGAVLFTIVARSYYSHEIKLRKRANLDLSSDVVQVVSVTNCRIIEIALINDRTPILAIDIGAEKILFLQGQWLSDNDSYGAPDLIGDPYEEFLNGLPDPHSFPSTSFTIARLPNSGEVFRIDVRGKYLAPEKTVDVLKNEYNFGDSEIFEGELDQISEVLAKEHIRRATK